ncbi:DEAD/DEAH box helicase [Epilithonimonas vandammei]|uniref:DEAD/DEAH box helicase n=1 Tax=Epilithonimonas vandammei TaxID=2487072 RepID=UPI0028A04ACB|nr:AAA domain-containing protein [Epilithonimonas vandammei]
MNVNGIEFFDDLTEIHNEQNGTTDKYPKLRSLLERVCKDLTTNESIQFSNLFSRLNYVCEKTNLDRRKTFQINTLRINANNVLHADFKPTQEDYLQNLKALCNALSHFYGIAIPKSLSDILPKTEFYKPKQRQGKKYDRIRIEVSSTDEQYIYAFDEENPTEEPIKIKHHVSGINEEFNSTIAKLWKGCQLNLIDVTVDEQGIYLPDLIILEPDYLLDISSLAECMKEYGKHPLNFVQSKFEAIKNTAPILMGNAANSFLDEFVNEQSHSPVDYTTAMKKVFKSAPFEFSTCSDLATREKEIEFFQSTKIQFQNIKNVVNNVFPEKSIDRENALLEPNFICEHLGVQGRLDFLQLQSKDGKKFVIELKSGKAPFPENNFELIGLNHRSQAFIYQIIIQKILGVQFRDLNTFILYSKYTDPNANLRLSAPFMAAIKEIMNIRNLIVANEKSIASDNTETQTRNIVNSISPTTLITNNNIRQNFLDNYIIPQINHFKSFFQNASELELEYFHSFYSFVTKEHYISKAGDTEYDSTKGISSLWLSSVEEKFESGEILTDLSIAENLTETDLPTIKLKIPTYDHDFLPNFRQGDIVILYERNNQKDNVTNKQIFKGSIQELTPTEITIRIRYKQRNQSVLPQNSKYAVEHDFLDSSYNSMYRGLYAFLQANQDRKDLLLNKRQLVQDETNYMENVYETKEIQQIVYKAKIAKDYFLLIGPPGTGKTSLALKSMVEEFYCEPNNNILLLSYTNRAVDEICDALDNVKDNPSYIRIGSELSCELKHRKRLLEKVIEHCENRNEVKAKIQEHRIFVGTVASLSNKTELFKLKHFQVAIIDEASQILEPSLVGILSAKNGKGGNAIDKFILIGDHKQLPAVVLQNKESSKVTSVSLNQIGLSDRKNSLFERLYNLHKADKKSLVWGMLHKQGRMHPDIALFPNYSFYNSQLEAVPTIHQSSNLEYNSFENENPFHKLIASKRIAFIPSEKHKADKTNKTNTYEAKIVKELVKQIFALYKANNLHFSVEETIGIITPYRSQIALIKREIHDLNIPELNAISVDTVERFQGSQRDIIIYSFSINQFYQLDFLSNNIEDEGQIIDRKLNVAITRAKKQLFVIGNPSILSNNLTYYRFIEFIRSKSGYIKERSEDFLKGNFTIEEPETDIEIGNNIYEPEQNFASVFDSVVIQQIKADSRTQYPHILYGYTNDYIRNNVIEYGRTNFDQATLEHSSADKVNLYCFYNMRKHYFSSVAIFKSFHDYFKTAFTNSNNRITFIDFGCGPLTSGLAFQQSFAYVPNFHFDYVGIDISTAMLNKAKEFSVSGLFSRDTKSQFVKSLNEISESYWESVFTLSNTVILNFSYLFGNLSKEDTERIAEKINALLDKYPLNKFVLVFQNSAMEKRNRSYVIFKKLVPRLQSVTEYAKTERVVYRNAVMSNFDKSEEVYYELLSN